jgi:hypothetical protein
MKRDEGNIEPALDAQNLTAGTLIGVVATV